MSISDAAEHGSHLDLLVALRYKIAETVENGCAARDLVGLSRRMIDIDSAIRALVDEQSSTGLHLVEDDTFDPESV